MLKAILPRLCRTPLFFPFNRSVPSPSVSKSFFAEVAPVEKYELKFSPLPVWMRPRRSPTAAVKKRKMYLLTVLLPFHRQVRKEHRIQELMDIENEKNVKKRVNATKGAFLEVRRRKLEVHNKYW